MTRHCSVYGCRSNYSTEKEATSTFSLPKDPLLRTQWLLNIRTDFKNVKNPAICIKHFDESVIIRKDRVLYKGEWKEYPRLRPKLKPGALPTIFPGIPSTSHLPTSSCLVESLGEASDENVLSHEEHLWISSLDDIMNFYDNELSKRETDWICIRKYGKVFLCLMDMSNSYPETSGCITITESLDFDVFANKVKIPRKKLPVKMSSLRSLNSLEELISFVEKTGTEQDKTERWECPKFFMPAELNLNL